MRIKKTVTYGNCNVMTREKLVKRMRAWAQLNGTQFLSFYSMRSERVNPNGWGYWTDPTKLIPEKPYPHWYVAFPTLENCDRLVWKGSRSQAEFEKWNR